MKTVFTCLLLGLLIAFNLYLMHSITLTGKHVDKCIEHYIHLDRRVNLLEGLHPGGVHHDDK